MWIRTYKHSIKFLLTEVHYIRAVEPGAKLPDDTVDDELWAICLCGVREQERPGVGAFDAVIGKVGSFTNANKLVDRLTYEFSHAQPKTIFDVRKFLEDELNELPDTLEAQGAPPAEKGKKARSIEVDDPVVTKKKRRRRTRSD